jgi:hypothetical protein
MYDNLQMQIKRRMVAKSLNIQSLEKKAGLKISAVRNILNGTSKKPNVFTLYAIAEALDCSILDLLGSDVGATSGSAYESPNAARPWAGSLFSEIVNIVRKTHEERKCPLSSDKALAMIQEIYYYSLSKNEAKMDENFCQWVIDKNMSTRLTPLEKVS